MSKAFKDDVARQIDRFKKFSLVEIERAVAKKRIGWIEKNVGPAKLTRLISPRQAFELFFFDYMSLDPDDLPVESESDNEITWRSCNDCPNPEASRSLGLDTRIVCRAAYEKSTQAFFSALDPRLRFHRSYREIRPYSPHCLESLIRIDFDEMMWEAVEEARASLSEGNKGYGAVVVMGNEIIARAHDTATTAGDPSLHAEMTAIRQAVAKTGDSNLCGAILFSTCEPCPMCSSLAVWANVTSIVFGTSIEDTAEFGKSRIQVKAQEIVNKSPALIEVIGGVLKDECLKLYS